MEAYTLKLQKILQNKSIKYGLPFIIVILGGSFGLKEFTSLRYEFSNVSLVKPEDIKKEGVYMKKKGEVTLEGEYEKLKTLDIDNWKQVRGPRPWEEETLETNKSSSQ